MSKRGRASRRSRGTTAALIVIAVVVVALGTAALFIATPLLQHNVREAAASDTTVDIVADGAQASVPLASRWWSEQTGASSVTVWSPDGGLMVEFALSATADAYAAVTELAPDDGVELAREQTPTANLLHARAGDGESIAGAVYNEQGVVTFVAQGPPQYDAALAHLLAGVEIGP